MDELKLTIQEAQELLLLSQSSVYSWIDKGKLHCIETPGGKIIVISDKEAQQIRNLNKKSRKNKVSKVNFQQTETEEIQPEAPFVNPEFVEKEVKENSSKPAQDVTLELVKKIEQLAVEAGRFKQLEILRNEEKENAIFWRDKYLEVASELKQKELEISALNKQIDELKRLKNRENKGILGIFKKN